MTLTLDISPDAEERLKQRAAFAGIPLSEFVSEIVEEASRSVEQPKPITGTELVAQWKADGVIGAWADRDDIGDSAEYARQLRSQAEQRDWT